MNVNYKQLDTALYNRNPYNHGSSHAIYTNDNHYMVYSYTTLILDYDYTNGYIKYYNNNRYSSTTSRLQNLIKNNFNVAQYLQAQPDYITA